MEWDEKVRQVSRMNEPSRVSDRPLVSHCRSLHFPSVVLSLGVLSSRGFLVHSSFIHSPLGYEVRWRTEEPTKRRGNGPDCYQRLEFFIQVLRVLCPNLTDASHPPFTPFPSRIVRFRTFTSQYAPQAGVTGGNATRRERRERSGNNMRRKPAVS